MRKLRQTLGMAFFGMLLACNCYGLNSSNTFETFMFLGWRDPNTLNLQPLDCDEFYFTMVEGDAAGRTVVSWDSPSEAIGLFYYDGDRQIHQISVENGYDTQTYTLDWDSIESDTVDVEARTIGPLGDVCVIRASFERPEPAATVVGMICDNLALTSPLGGMANGMETFYWNSLEGATGYRLKFFDNQNLLLEAEAGADATSLSLNVSSAAIGGETPLTVELIAFDAQGNECGRLYSIAREAAPPQNPEPVLPTSTPTCEQAPSSPYC